MYWYVLTFTLKQSGAYFRDGHVYFYSVRERGKKCVHKTIFKIVSYEIHRIGTVWATKYYLLCRYWIYIAKIYWGSKTIVFRV